MMKVDKLTVQKDPKDNIEGDKYLLDQLEVPVPSNESTRLCLLRESTILDSNLHDPEYDRYTSMAKRLFGVPISLVSLVDIDRQWFKSSIGLDVYQTHRNHAFCSYTILPNTEDVMIVLDALLDDRFKDNPLVLGPPFIRFYAGAAIEVEGVKLGSLCVIDSKPWITFDLDMQMNLLDIANAVALLIARRRKAAINEKNARATSVLDLMNDFHKPLSSMNKAFDNLQKQVTIDSPSMDVRELITEAGACLRAIGINIETNLSLAPIILRKKEILKDVVTGEHISDDIGNYPAFSMDSCNIFDIIENAKHILSTITYGNTLDWLIDRSSLSLGEHLCYPDVILYTIISAINNVAKTWAKISVFIGYRKYKRFESIVEESDKAVMQGRLSIEIHASGKMSVMESPHMSESDTMKIPSSTSTTLNVLNEYYSVEKVLEDVGGGARQLEIRSYNSVTGYIGEMEYRHHKALQYEMSFDPSGFDLLVDDKLSEDEYQKLHDYWIPCKIRLVSKESENQSTSMQIMVINSKSPDPVSFLFSASLKLLKVDVAIFDDCDHAIDELLQKQYDVCFVDIAQTHSSGASFFQVYQNRSIAKQMNLTQTKQILIFIGLSLNQMTDKTMLRHAFGHGLDYFVDDPTVSGAEAIKWIIDQVSRANASKYFTSKSVLKDSINNYLRSHDASSFCWLENSNLILR